MSKISRYVGNLLAFASGSTALNRTLFGDSPNQSDVLTDNINAESLLGWEAGLDPVNGFPPQEYFNAVGFIATQLSAYLHQYGIAEWDSLQEYYIGSITNVAGVLYRSLTDANIGNIPVSSPADWASIFDESSNLVKESIVQDGGVATGSTQMPFDASIPQITEGDEFMSLVHTPADAANILTITVNNMCSHGSASAGHITSALFRDAVANALVATSDYSSTLDLMSSFSYEFQMVAGGVAPITFRNRIGKNVAGTLSFNGTPSAGLIHGGIAASSIRVVETKP